MENLILTEGERNSIIPSTPAVRLGANGRGVEAVAAEACASKDAFYIVFIHADTGGRALERGIEDRSLSYCKAMEALCQWPSTRCLVVAPRHETEAWILADPSAITKALGYNGAFTEIGLPEDAKQAEKLPDPKEMLSNALSRARGQRRPNDPERIFPAIAQRQRIDMLRRSASFQSFENSLRLALRDLGAVR
jgi:hypothetical protein